MLGIAELTQLGRNRYALTDDQRDMWVRAVNRCRKAMPRRDDRGAVDVRSVEARNREMEGLAGRRTSKRRSRIRSTDHGVW